MRLFALILMISGLIAPVSVKADRTIIFAAASLRDALIEVVDSTGMDVSISYASSGVLARQISQGAPAGIYLSANAKWADWLANRIKLAENRDFLSNRLVLITHIKQQKEIYLDGRLSDSLIDSRLVIGDVNHVPAGIYAKIALQNMKLWPSVENYIAQTTDVRAALLLVVPGEAVAGITYQTDAFASEKIRIIDTFPATAHPPIIYKAVLLDEFVNTPAKGVYEKLLSPEAYDIYKEYGFTFSGE